MSQTIDDKPFIRSVYRKFVGTRPTLRDLRYFVVEVDGCQVSFTEYEPGFEDGHAPLVFTLNPDGGVRRVRFHPSLEDISDWVVDPELNAQLDKHLRRFLRKHGVDMTTVKKVS